MSQERCVQQKWYVLLTDWALGHSPGHSNTWMATLSSLALCPMKAPEDIWKSFQSEQFFLKSLYPSYLIYQHPMGRAMEKLIGHLLSDGVWIAQLGRLHSVGSTWEREGVGIENQAGKVGLGGGHGDLPGGLGERSIVSVPITEWGRRQRALPKRKAGLLPLQGIAWLFMEE